jgi:hypothetical protein
LSKVILIILNALQKEDGLDKTYSEYIPKNSKHLVKNIIKKLSYIGNRRNAASKINVIAQN